MTKRVLVAYAGPERFPVLLVDEITMISQPKAASHPVFSNATRIYGALPSYLRLEELRSLLAALPVPFDVAVCDSDTESQSRTAFRAKVPEPLPFQESSFLVQTEPGIITLELIVEGEQPRLGPENPAQLSR